MGMIFASFSRALGQWGDARFRRVVGLGVGLTLALLVALYALMIGAIQWLVPETTDLPLLGPVGGLDTLLSLGSILLMLLASVFLMVPVASAFTGLFLEDVVDAVEDRHYPALPPARPQTLGEGLIGAVNFFGIALGANLIALFLWPFAGPLVPVLFWGLNGYLLGREYFTLVAQRRLGRLEARRLWRANRARIWGAGILMAAPLSIPVVNLLIPVFGVATFAHLFHRIAAPGPTR
jgi:CysZ protein